MEEALLAVPDEFITTFANFVAKIGMVTVFGLILTPVPAFLFCGLTQKEKEARIQSFSFSYLLLSLLNNLIWLAYGQKSHDQNISLPSIVGTAVGVLLIFLYLSVRSTRNQVIACFVLVSIAEFFFSNMIPAFVTGTTASFLSISTYFSTLGQIPQVIRERDARYISFPIVCISLLNSSLWLVYAGIKKDIPFFMTQFLALIFMSINLIFYLWANNVISSESIQSLITIFAIAFPESEVNLDKEFGIEESKDLETQSVSAQKHLAQEQFAQNGFKEGEVERGTERSGMERSTQATETTRLRQSASMHADGLRNPYLVQEPVKYTGDGRDTISHFNNSTSGYLIDESTMDMGEESRIDYSRMKSADPAQMRADAQSAQRLSQHSAAEHGGADSMRANESVIEEERQSQLVNGDEGVKSREVLREDESMFDFQIEDDR